MVNSLAQLLRGRRVVALTGAGCSTESGIPDYRGPETARRARNPIRFQDFVKSPEGRQRYWARSFVGWPRMAQAKPNPGHRALAWMEQRGHLSAVITQNVDRLHQASGSRAVIELHGALAEVVCLGCGRLSKRADLQARLAALNPGFGGAEVEIAPDGDAELIEVSDFQVARCGQCEGDLKPHVVFFGENVPRHRVTRAYALVDEADVLLVVGSSLTVFSGFRFVKRAHARGIPVAILNLGPTRGDPLATLKLDARIGEALPALTRLL